MMPPAVNGIRSFKTDKETAPGKKDPEAVFLFANGPQIWEVQHLNIL